MPTIQITDVPLDLLPDTYASDWDVRCEAIATDPPTETNLNPTGGTACSERHAHSWGGWHISRGYTTATLFARVPGLDLYSYGEEGERHYRNSDAHADLTHVGHMVCTGQHPDDPMPCLACVIESGSSAHGDTSFSWGDETGFYGVEAATA